MKIIFLDNDGVICLASNWGSRRKKRIQSGNYNTPENELPVNCRFDNFDQKAIKILNQILLETGAEIVVSSDWKLFATLEEIGDYYIAQGISKKPIGFTKELGQCDVPENFIWTPGYDLEQSRSLEILQYLKDHPEVTNWVAVDDLDMGIPKSPKNVSELNRGWGLTNFVHTPKQNEGIKQNGIKSKLLKYLNGNG